MSKTHLSGPERPEVRPAKVDMLRVARPVVAPAVVLGVMIAGWSLYSENSAGHLFPSVGQVFSGLGHSLVSGSDWEATLRSWRSLGIGYGIASGAGIPLGLMLGRSRVLDRIFGVYLDIALVIPMIVLMPVVLLALGVTAKAEVAVVVLFALPYVVLPVRNHVRAMPKEWFDLARSLDAPRRKLWTFVLVPGSRSGIILGLRLGLAHALTGVFVVELTLVSIGIGNVILTDQAMFDFGRMIGYIILVMAQIVLVMAALRVLAGKQAAGSLWVR